MPRRRSRRRSRRSKSRRRGKCYGRMSGRRGGGGCYKRRSRSRSKRRTHCDGRSSRRRGKSYGCGSRMSRGRSRRRAAFGMAAVKAAMANPELTRDAISAGARLGAEILEKHPEVLDTVRRSMRRGKPLGTTLEDYRAMFDRRSRRRSRRRGAYHYEKY